MNSLRHILQAFLAVAICVAAAAPLRAQDAPPAPGAKADSAAAREATLAFLRAASEGRFDDAKALLSPDAVARVEAAMPGASAEAIIGLLALGGPALDYSAFRPEVSGDTAATTAGIWRVEPIDGKNEVLFKVALKRVDGAWKLDRIAPATPQEMSAGATALAGGAESDVEARLSRAVADGRIMHTAVASFMVDNDAYPAWVLGSDPNSASRDFHTLANLPTFQANPGPVTPIAYITRLLTDPFSTEGAHYAYYSVHVGSVEEGLSQGGFILFSPGPDGDYDLTLEILQAEFRREKGDGTEAGFSTGAAGMRGNIPGLAPYLYDPTNGLESGGDVARYAMVMKQP